MQGDIVPRRKTDRVDDASIKVQQAPEEVAAPKQVDSLNILPETPQEPTEEPKKLKPKRKRPIGVIMLAIIMCTILIGLVVYGSLNKANSPEQSVVPQKKGNVYTDAGIDYLPAVQPVLDDLSSDSAAQVIDISPDLSDESLGL